MAWICLSLVLYRVILTIIIVVEVVKLNDEISNYRDCCADKGGCSENIDIDDEDASSEEKNQRAMRGFRVVVSVVGRLVDRSPRSLGPHDRMATEV